MTIEEFFGRYEEGANNFDPELVSSHFTEVFAGADPNGVVCVTNDDAFREAIPQRGEFMRGIGFRSARVLGIDKTILDDHYTMAKVHWHMVFEKEAGVPMDFRFFISYVLYDDGSGPRVAFYISHDDEQKVMREAGLIPAEGAG